MKAFTKISAKDRHRKENFQGYFFDIVLRTFEQFHFDLENIGGF